MMLIQRLLKSVYLLITGLLAYLIASSITPNSLFAATFSVLASGQDTSLSLTGIIEPDPDDVGKMVQLYLGVSINGQLFMKYEQGWMVLSPDLDIPSFKQLEASQEIRSTLIEGIDVSNLVGTQFFVGYGENQADLLSGKYQMVHEIRQPSQLAYTPDFAATQGKVDRDTEEDGPWDKRLVLATSTDGLEFVSRGIVIADQANVPDMVITKDETIFLYFTGWTVGDLNNISAVAISTDLGLTWSFKHIHISGFNATPVDPDIVLLDNDSFRLYFTAPNSNVPAIHCADSTDGINFAYGGVAYGIEGEAVIDSTTMKIADTWHMYVLGGGHATSSDGMHFTRQDNIDFRNDNEMYIVSNELTTDNTVRLFGFSITHKDFRSFISSDGFEWQAESEVRMAYDENSVVEDSYIKDPTIVQMPDGSYLMVYVSFVPDN